MAMPKRPIRDIESLKFIYLRATDLATRGVTSIVTGCIM
ncbi:MAG: hypothetical protein ACI81Q_000539, partial [Paracoccaceae bacterium]